MESDQVPIDSDVFPDPAFLDWVEQQDADEDGFLSESERDAVTNMDLRKQGIQDLTGLEWFQSLEKLNCSENDLVELEIIDFPALQSLTCNENPRLETIYARKNKLLAIRIPDDIEPFCVLTEQRPATFDLPAGENGFLLSDLVPWMDADQVSQLNGAVLQDDRIQLDSPNQTITYHYTDGAAELDATVTVTGENDWQVPLHIDNWTYGEPATQPQAQPAFGTAAFFYASSPEGPFQPEVPVHAGTWYVQAIVEESPQYTGLESVASFEIYPARPEYLAPNMKSATYGDYLADVSLESQFFWENGSLRVGNVGEQTHLAFYIPSNLIDYQMVEHIPVVVNVSPYDGTRLPIPQVSSRAEA
ncbi:hypothetical protein [Butyricicoccus pullicaecorum]|uniref:hypothetical protein n=1 Tax=Butyricicoccus pullicaecorum TaxID=501571 RepID=UPI0035205485